MKNPPTSPEAPSEMALPGLHDAVWACLQPLLLNAPIKRVIDVAAGQGAFISRFCSDCHRVACDLPKPVFPGRCDEFIGVDLNKQWDALHAMPPFNLAMAMEIIEHVENPWSFMRGLSSLLAPSGYCVVTSPNIQDKASRLDYLFRGDMPWFNLTGTRDAGHITPIIVPLFYVMAASAGFSLHKFYHFGVRKPLKLNWRGRLFEKYLDYKMTGSNLDGVINIWILRKEHEPGYHENLYSPGVLEQAERFGTMCAEPCPVM